MFQAHGIDSWMLGRGILVRMCTLIATNQLHLLHFNHSHLVYKFLVALGRWCIDPSHRSDDALPLNGGSAKELSIQRYRKVIFPTLIEMLIAFNNHRISQGVPWSACWVFKEDIKACFPQMDMEPSSALLLAIRLTVDVVFIHLAGSFGWTGAPMAWSVIGSAMLRLCKARLLAIMLYLICDDFVGMGTSKLETSLAAQFARETILATCGPGSVSLDKSVLTQQPIVIGWYVDFFNPLGASIASCPTGKIISSPFVLWRRLLQEGI